MFIKVSNSQNLNLSSHNKESKSSLKLNFPPENTPDFYRDLFWNDHKLMIMHKLNFITVDFTAQMQYFVVRVANFEPEHLGLFLVKIQSFCVHWTGNLFRQLPGTFRHLP